MHVADLVGRREEGTERREGVAALSLDPLSATLELEDALGVVVVQDVARDVRERVRFRDVAGALPTTTASSTSQSVFVLPFGMTTSSFGPTIALVALKKITGSDGTAIPDSRA